MDTSLKMDTYAFDSPQGLAWISDNYFKSFSLLSNVWIDRPLMLSSDVTTQKPGSDFDWSKLLHNHV